MSGGWQSTNLDDLAKALGVDGSSDAAGDRAAYEPGDWFCVGHEHVITNKGAQFSSKPEGGDGRRVLLGNRHGPNATMYARSATVEEGVEHPRHDDGHNSGRCKLNKRGWVLFARRVSVPDEQLTAATFSCSEPPDSDLRSHLSQARRL